MKQIDHDPKEPKVDRGPGPWKMVIPALSVVFLLNLLTRDIDWVSLCLGVFIGVVLLAWAVDITGNKIPDSWRGKPPRTGRPGPNK